MKSKGLLSALLLCVLLSSCAGGSAQTSADGVDTTPDTYSGSAVQTPIGYTDLTDETERQTQPTDLPDPATGFSDGGYTYADSVNGLPTESFGVYRSDTDDADNGGKDPAEKSDSYGDGIYNKSTEPDPTDGTEGGEGDVLPPIEPGEDEITVPDMQNIYAEAIAAVVDGYSASVKLGCTASLSDGSSSVYDYNYAVECRDGVYSSHSTVNGVNIEQSYPGTKKSKAEFLMACSMIEPIELTGYYFEKNASGTLVHAALNGEDLRATLLGSSTLFRGFDKKTPEELKIGRLYISALVSPDGTPECFAYSFSFTVSDNALGDVDFKVDINVTYK